MVSLANSILSRLLYGNDVKQSQDKIKEYLNRSQWIELYELATLLLQQVDFNARQFVYFIFQQLILTHSFDAVEIALRLERFSTQELADSSFLPKNFNRVLAEGLAAEQPIHILISILKQREKFSKNQECLACWVQESVIRGNDLSIYPEIREFWHELKGQNILLANLPLKPWPIEYELRNYLPTSLGDNPGNKTAIIGSSRDPFYELKDKGRLLLNASKEKLAHFVFTKRELPAFLEAWPNQNSGWVGCMELFFPVPLSPDTLSQEHFFTLGSDALNGVCLEELETRQVSSGFAFALLFTVLRQEGTYFSGLQGAYGRLTIWRLIESIVRTTNFSLEEEEEVEVESYIRSCAWFHFFPGNPQVFNTSLENVGVGILRPDGQSLVLISYTNTD